VRSLPLSNFRATAVIFVVALLFGSAESASTASPVNRQASVAAPAVPAPPPPVAPALPAPPAAAPVTPVEPEEPDPPRIDPASVQIPKINAQSTLAPMGLQADGSLQVPPTNTPKQAGWYIGGPAPGEIGAAVLLGHFDGNKQPGIFYRLRELVPGDEVLVTRKDGSVLKFLVRGTQQVSKTAFPTDVVYGDTEQPELRLITCGGGFDRKAHSYLDNLIVFAVQAP
jgi:hypothetical protein